MTKKEIAHAAVDALKAEYPDAKCSLDYKTPLQLLIATRLSAQCTDARVNLVTPALFERFPDAESFAQAEVSEVAEYIKSCGLFKTKSRDIVAMAQMILDDFGGEVPDNIDDLTKLPGVGRKTANLICGDVYGKPAVVVDTHCNRPEKDRNRAAQAAASRGEQQLLSQAGAARQSGLHRALPEVRTVLHERLLPLRENGAEKWTLSFSRWIWTEPSCAAIIRCPQG